MMLLFLVEDNTYTFFHDFKSVNIDLANFVFCHIMLLDIGEEYVFGDTTVRRVAYTISDGLCIVGDRVFGILPNGDVDFSKQISTEYTICFASGDCHFVEKVYGSSFNLLEFLEDNYGGVVRLAHYESDRFYVKSLGLDVYLGGE